METHTKSSNQIKGKTQNRLNTLSRHLLVWLIIYVFFYVGQVRLAHNFAIWDALMVVLSLATIFYSNNNWRRKSNGKKLRYRFKSIGLIIVVSGINVYTEYIAKINQHYGIEAQEDDWYTLFSITIFIVFNSCAFLLSEFIALQKEFNKHRFQISQLKEEHSEAQLELLRSKIDPHFLFNSLNSIYSMSYLNDKRTPEKIMQLSDMLRYVLYDCNSAEVSLKKEIEYFKTYIDLHQLRSKYDQNVNLKVFGKYENIMIAPMLLLPFIENAYKHSHIIREKRGYIDIQVEIIDYKLQFIVENSIPDYQRENLTFTSGGIGIENVKKRLELQYPNKYCLDITANKHEYKVDLTLIMI